MIRLDLPTLGRLSLALGLLLLAGAGISRAVTRDDFDHEEHRKLFPTCTTCHAGVLEEGRAVFPDAAACKNCHDGTVEKAVEWRPPTVVRPTNLRFSHRDHRTWAAEKIGADSAIACGECHTPAGGRWMTIERTITGRCLDCHGIKVAHLSAPDTACATCHVPLAEARALPRERVAGFEEPPSHKVPDFMTERGHGRLATPPRGSGLAVAPSCATCHARDFCAQCHVNAPEVRTIQALAPDPRSLALEAELKEPQSHERMDFLSRHGAMAERRIESCATCHTAESCLACHRATPSVAQALPAAGPGRAPGASITRRRPASHTPDFADRHGPDASANPATCSTCHTRSECLDCHRPDPGRSGSYHPAGFLTRHPSAAYNRQSDCSECHNPQQFCSTCHVQSGLRSSGTIDPGYHDGKRGFLLNHGTAARQSLESCVTCHTERDCLLCHSAVSGRRFNPHGPGFNAERLARRNPQSCSACHGRSIPGRE
jgi:hypothetical protein